MLMVPKLARLLGAGVELGTLTATLFVRGFEVRTLMRNDLRRELRVFRCNTEANVASGTPDGRMRMGASNGLAGPLSSAEKR